MNGNYDRPANIRQNINNNNNGGWNGNNGVNGSRGANTGGSGGEVNRLQTLLQTHPEFKTPPQQTFDSEEMEGSIQKILSENIGAYIVVEFLIGTDRIHRKQGFLYHVGTSYITLYDDENENFILCDIFSVKFVYFYLPGQRPNRNFNILPSSNGNMG